MSDATPSLISGTDGATFAALSPAGDWMAFFIDRTLKKIPTSGGPATTLAVTSPGPLDWGRNDTIVISSPVVVRQRGPRTLSLVSASAGTVRDLESAGAMGTKSWLTAPRMIHDAGVVLFSQVTRGGGPDLEIGLASLSDGA